MATTKQEYYFYPGKKSKHRNAGILVVENKYKFLFNRRTKDGVHLDYICSQTQSNLGCKARAKVIRREDGSYFLYKTSNEHNHFVFEAAIIAEELKQKMAEIVRKEPIEPVSDAIEKVTLDAKEQYNNDKILLKDILQELGTDKSMEHRLYRVRDQVIGKMPRGRADFNPKELLRRIHGNKAERVELLDSDNIDDNWEDIINKNNPNSPYFWNRMSEDLKQHEDNDDKNIDDIEEDEAFDEEYMGDSSEEVTIEDIGPEDVNTGNKEDKKKPKRVLAYTTQELLKLFELAERSSVDGTFKSICKLWKQQFIWMLKVKGKISVILTVSGLLTIYVYIYHQVTGFQLCGDGFLTRQKLVTRSYYHQSHYCECLHSLHQFRISYHLLLHLLHCVVLGLLPLGGDKTEGAQHQVQP